jgi:uncharacterized protein (DUF1330 family)
MPALLIVDTKIHQADLYEEYKALAKPMAEKFGGQYIHRGGDISLHDSALWSPTRLVIIKFPSVDDAEGFLASPDYQPVKALRHKYADSTSLIVEIDE